jgi:hypothetical protein
MSSSTTEEITLPITEYVNSAFCGVCGEEVSLVTDSHTLTDCLRNLVARIRRLEEILDN